MTAALRVIDAEPYDWRDHARCQGVDPDVFFPDRSAPNSAVQAAKDICATCPVQEPCLEGALARNEKFGIWGGASFDDRRAIRRRRRLAAVRAV